MAEVTIIIPIGPGHEAAAENAIASAQAQTLDTDIITVRDSEGRGPGWARNRGLSRVETQQIVFLDADDLLHPQFVERTLPHALPGRYVFTGWFEEGVAKEPPQRPWCAGAWHVITALLPTTAVKRLGGFDENLPGAEDTDFFLKVVTNKLCGIRIPDALMHYTNSSSARSKRFKASAEHDRVMAEINRRYSGKMGCCGDIDVEQMPIGERQPGDVLAMAMWGGNRTEMGYVSGRRYPRTGNRKLVWVDPRDVADAPHLWREVEESAVDTVPALQGAAGIAGAFMTPHLNAIKAYLPPTAIPSGPKTPDVEGVIRRYRASAK